MDKILSKILHLSVHGLCNRMGITRQRKRHGKKDLNRSQVSLGMMCVLFVIILWSVMVNNDEKLVLDPAIINDAFSSVST